MDTHGYRHHVMDPRTYIPLPAIRLPTVRLPPKTPPAIALPVVLRTPQPTALPLCRCSALRTLAGTLKVKTCPGTGRVIPVLDSWIAARPATANEDWKNRFSVESGPYAIGMRIEELLLNHGPWIGIDDLEYDKFTRRNRRSTETINRSYGIHVVQKRPPSPFPPRFTEFWRPFSPSSSDPSENACSLRQLAQCPLSADNWDCTVFLPAYDLSSICFRVLLCENQCPITS